MSPLTYDPLDPPAPSPPPLRLVQTPDGRLQYVPADTPAKRWTVGTEVVDWQGADPAGVARPRVPL